MKAATTVASTKRKWEKPVSLIRWVWAVNSGLSHGCNKANVNVFLILVLRLREHPWVWELPAEVWGVKHLQFTLQQLRKSLGEKTDRRETERERTSKQNKKWDTMLTPVTSYIQGLLVQLPREAEIRSKQKVQRESPKSNKQNPQCWGQLANHRRNTDVYMRCEDT